MESYQKLEIEFGSWIGNQNTVAVSSGTSALHLAFEVLKATYGFNQDSIILGPEFTMVACPRSIVMAGLKNEFRDCENNLLMNPVDECCGIDALLAVHIYGRRCNMESFHKHRLPVIEDLAEAHGIPMDNRSFAGCWSFYKNKQIYGEEGGMIAFREKEAADLARKLRSLGFDSNHNYLHIPRGVNARMSNLHAEPILKSLSKVNENLEIRACQSAKYDAWLPIEWKMSIRDVHWVHDVRIPGLTFTVQDLIVRECRNRGLEARHGFKPMSMQPEFSKGTGFNRYINLNAYRLAQEVIYLPLGPNLKLEDIKWGAETFTAVCRSFGIVPG